MRKQENPIPVAYTSFISDGFPNNTTIWRITGSQPVQPPPDRAVVEDVLLALAARYGVSCEIPIDMTTR